MISGAPSSRTSVVITEFKAGVGGRRNVVASHAVEVSVRASQTFTPE